MSDRETLDTSMHKIPHKLRRRFGELKLRLDPVDFLEDVQAEHGNFVVWGDDPPTVFVSGGDLTKQVLSQRSFDNQTLRGPEGSGLEVLLNGLVFLNGETHRHQRRIMAPAFHKQAVQQYLDDMVAITDDALSDVPDGYFDVVPLLTEITFRITLKTLFGVDESLGDLGAKITQWVHYLTNPLSYVLPYRVPGLPYKRLLDISDELVASTETIMADLRRRGGDMSILNTLMNSSDEEGNSFTDEQLIGHVSLIFLAGHETSRNALSFIVYLLAQHPEIAQAVQDEVRDLLAEQPISFHSLSEMNLLRNVILEAMRLMPPTAWMDKYANEAVEIGGETFPEGTMFILGHYFTHRDPEVYDYPNRFIPERWNELERTVPRYSFVPFSAGSRMCIGSEFAMIEMQIVLALLLQKYQFTLEDGQKADRLIRATMQMKNGLQVRFMKKGLFKRTQIHGNLANMVEFK